MANLEVIPVQNRREEKQFVNLAWDIYRDDPNWVPPLIQNQLELLNYRRHPFYDDGEIQTFLALRDGKPVGRIAAIVNNGHIRRHKEQRGFFGFFESIDDQEVTNLLFDAARDWLKERDITKIRGPMNPSMNYECGLLIDGFDSQPTFMMTYNRPYYQKLIEDYGFVKTQDMYAFWGHTDMIEGLDKKLKFVVEEATRRFDVKLRMIDKSRFLEDVKMFLDIYNQSLVGTWGFVPMSEGEINMMAKSLKHLIVPEMTSVAEVDGRPVGASFGLLDYNPRIKKINGRLFPFGFMRLLWNKRAIKRVRIISTNVIPEYHKWGLGLVILDRLVPDLFRLGVEEAEFSWVLESNHLSYKTLKRGGAHLTKSYRLFDYGPTEDKTEDKTEA
ncbi:MAG: hypothetical protein ACI9G1_003073 [Pirellulaceae bacterium]|jgi:hypothetical protein